MKKKNGDYSKMTDQELVSTMTGKQKHFCDEMLIDFNGTQAAIRIGCSVKSARKIAIENMSTPSIQEYIRRKITKGKDKVIPSEKFTLRRLLELTSSYFTEEYEHENIIPLLLSIKCDLSGKIKTVRFSNNKKILEFIFLNI